MKTPRPWEQRKGESPEAYAAFLIYRDMEPKRTLEAVGRECSKGVSLLARWSARHGWVERRRDWDKHIQNARDKVRAAYAAKWERRREEAIEEGYQLSVALKQRVDWMMDYPLMRKEVKKTVSINGVDVPTVTVIEPVNWTMSDMIRMIRTQVELKAAVFNAAGPDLEKMTDEELEAVENADLPDELRPPHLRRDFDTDAA